MDLFKKFFQGLKKTKDAFSAKLALIFGKGELDEAFYEELETILLSADFGVQTSEKIIENLKIRAKKAKLKTVEDVKNELKQIIKEILKSKKLEKNFPLVLTIVGVNGVGKTTAIGKLANKLKNEGLQVMLAAADTFRAGAINQLNEWADRAKVKIVKHKEGADPAAVVFDAIESAKAKKVDVLLIDTAGRLHNNVNLMKELEKIERVAGREWPDANKKTIIVLDASIGQNSLVQAELFNESVELDGIVLTKLDGTAKGGIVLQIKERLNIPVLYVGVGEKIDDIEEFDAESFAENIL